MNCGRILSRSGFVEAAEFVCSEMMTKGELYVGGPMRLGKCRGIRRITGHRMFDAGERYTVWTRTVSWRHTDCVARQWSIDRQCIEDDLREHVP